MHILLIHQAFAALDEPGGTRHHELARHLTARGHKVTVITSPISYLTGQSEKRQGWVSRETDDAGVTILRTYTYPALHRSFVHRVFSFLSFMASSFFASLQVKNVDLVWGTSPNIFQGATAWAVARLKGAAFLFEVRDLWPAFAIAVGVLKNRFLIGASERLERFLYRHADQVMVNSPGYVTHVQERGAKKVALLPNGADPAMFDPANDGTVFKTAHGLEGKFVVLYAGAHGMSNDLGVVLEAARLLQDRMDISVVFVGDGKEKANLVARAAEIGLTNVLFMPPVPKQKMAETLAGADAGIAILKPLELYKTTYPNKVFDYLAAGRPLALAIDGVVREVVEAAEAGIFVQPGDAAALAEAIRVLADDPEKSRRMGLAGRRYVEAHFSRADLAEKLCILLESMRKKHG